MKEFLADPEHSQLKLYDTRVLLANFFNKVFTVHNFFYVWYFMDGYVSYEGSSELGKYFIRCECLTVTAPTLRLLTAQLYTRTLPSR